MHITEKTNVSLFAVVCTLPFVAGTIIWLTMIDAKASAANQDLKGVKEIVQDILIRVTRIEERQKTRGKQ